MSGTSDTSRCHGCPCGRSHPDTGPYRRPAAVRPADRQELAEKAYQGFAEGKHRVERGRQVLAYAGNCTKPLAVKVNASTGALFVTYEVRCRKCPNCLRARTWYWGMAAMHQTEVTSSAGRRTWFGTLTFSPEWQEELRARAREKWMNEHASSSAVAEFWSDPKCDYAFAFVKTEVIAELKRYWKRLRKAKHRFKYIAVIERHRSGHPHVHWLLHEQDQPIRKRELQMHWPFGHSNVSIVGGRSKNAAGPKKAAWYVVKYLSKTVQSRQLASQNYRPEDRKKNS